MAPSPRQSIDAERPQPPQEPAPAAQYTVDDDDLYGAEPIGFSDGFRPSTINQQQHDDVDPASRPLPPSRTASNSSDDLPRPLSVQKPQPTQTFALRHDGGMGDLSADVPNPASEEPSLSRTISMESDGPIIIPEGPYQGPTRPSHAYRMYSHDSRLQRTASNVTASTMPVPRERAYDGPSGPTHPYALYPQNTVPDEPEPIVNNNIPIGFNTAVGQQYLRRTGPDGEEAADMIGPDGHLEQLPPYTRYPDIQFQRKTPPSSPPPHSARRISVDHAGAGGIGLATRNPEFSSNEELTVRNSSEPSRASTGAISNVSTANSASPTLPAVEMSEKVPAEDEKKWKKLARRRVCGIIPMWALCLAITVVVVVAVLLGAILGVIYSQRGDDTTRRYGNFHSTGRYITTVTTTVDATPLAFLPTDLPVLPTGDYELLIGPAMPSNSLCIVDQEHTSAWSCAMPATNMRLSIESLGSTAPNTSNLKVSFTPPEEALKSWSYGSQPPILDGQKVMNLVRDFDDPEYGPAWFFQVPYSKIVVLQENVFEGLIVNAVDENGKKFSYPLKKREEEGDWVQETTRKARRDTERRRKGIASPGDKPWFCYWKGTVLEGFLYPNTTSDAGDAAIQSSIDAAMAMSTTAPLPLFHHYSEGESATVLPRRSDPTQTVTSSSDLPKATKIELPQDDVTRPQYPRVVKIEERRLPRKQGYQAPYCVQMIIGSDGWSKEEVKDDEGRVRMFEVSERFGDMLLKREAWDEEKMWKEEMEGERTKWGRLEKPKPKLATGTGLAGVKRDLPNECHCIWMIE